MSSWLLKWMTNDDRGSAVVYRCAKHGAIGKDIVILQGLSDEAPSSGVLCHRCLVAMLNKGCKATEMK